MVKLALPTGSLQEKTLELFAAADWSVQREPRQQRGIINDPIFSEIGFFHPREVPALIAQGQYDIGICGWDCVVEGDVEELVRVVAKLPYAKAGSGEVRIVLFGSIDDEVEIPEKIPPGTIIVTEFPTCTRKFFEALGVRVQLRESRGSVEGLVSKPYRFGVCASETGTSLKTNNLRALADIMTSSTVLIASKAAIEEESKREDIQAINDILSGAIEAQQNVELKMNVSVSHLPRVLDKLPALKRPTVSPLAGNDESYFAVSTVAPRRGINQLIRGLKEVGAEGIIQSKLEKLIR